MDGGTGLRRNNRKFKNYKEQGDVESHDRLRHIQKILFEDFEEKDGISRPKTKRARKAHCYGDNKK